MSEFPALCLQAIKNNTSYPQLSQLQPEASAEQAYALQGEFLKIREEETIGYKAALTAPPAQQAMGLSEPIVGVLLTSTPKDAATPISIKPGGILETELGYTLKQPITAAVTAANVLEFVADITPMVEIALPNLADRPTGNDLIATNSATFGLLRGQGFKPQASVVDTIQAEMRTNEEVLFSGRCDEVMGGQLTALCWLINTVLSLGYALEAGHVLMTGSVGGVAPAQDGSYLAHFQLDGQTLDEIKFSLSTSV